MNQKEINRLVDHVMIEIKNTLTARGFQIRPEEDLALCLENLNDILQFTLEEKYGVRLENLKGD